MDILLNKQTGDATYINGPDIRAMVSRTAPVVVAQRLTIRLRTHLSEWFINTSYGVPYFQRILKKGIDKTTVDNLLREQIFEEPGVLEIVAFTSSLDPYSRSYSCSFEIRTAEGQASVTVNV